MNSSLETCGLLGISSLKMGVAQLFQSWIQKLANGNKNRVKKNSLHQMNITVMRMKAQQKSYTFF